MKNGKLKTPERHGMRSSMCKSRIFSKTRRNFVINEFVQNKVVKCDNLR